MNNPLKPETLYTLELLPSLGTHGSRANANENHLHLIKIRATLINNN